MENIINVIGEFFSTYLNSFVGQCISILSSVLIVLQVINEATILLSPIEARWFSRKFFTWRQVKKFIYKLTKKIEEEKNKTGIKYGMIVATGRGGGILVALLSYELGKIYSELVPVLVLDRQLVRNENQEQEGDRAVVVIESKVELDQRYEHLKHKPILLLTSRSDPGLTLDKYREVLKASGFTGKIHKSAILANEKTRDELEYCLKWYAPNTKVKGFPWEKKSLDLMKNIVDLKK